MGLCHAGGAAVSAVDLSLSDEAYKVEAANRFRAKFRVCAETGCWMWTGALNNKGYGQFRYMGSNKLAHRVSIILDGGELMEGKEVDHLCRNPKCVNPAHLEQVTHSINMRRSSAPSRTIERAKLITHCRHGHSLSGLNLYVHNGKRTCKRCKILRQQAYRSVAR